MPREDCPPQEEGICGDWKIFWWCGPLLLLLAPSRDQEVQISSEVKLMFISPPYQESATCLYSWPDSQFSLDIINTGNLWLVSCKTRIFILQPSWPSDGVWKLCHNILNKDSKIENFRHYSLKMIISGLSDVLIPDSSLYSPILSPAFICLSAAHPPSHRNTDRGQVLASDWSVAACPGLWLVNEGP